LLCSALTRVSHCQFADIRNFQELVQGNGNFYKISEFPSFPLRKMVKWIVLTSTCHARRKLRTCTGRGNTCKETRVRESHTLFAWEAQRVQALLLSACLMSCLARLFSRSLSHPHSRPWPCIADFACLRSVALILFFQTVVGLSISPSHPAPSGPTPLSPA